MNKYWFKPRRFGLGATPITWEGWAVVILFVLYMIYLSTNLNEAKIEEFYLNFIIAIVILIIVSYKKTDGKWKFRWS